MYVVYTSTLWVCVFLVLYIGLVCSSRQWDYHRFWMVRSRVTFSYNSPLLLSFHVLHFFPSLVSFTFLGKGVHEQITYPNLVGNLGIRTYS
jgi:hypothetical protein